jgi:hypothetical protein
MENVKTAPKTANPAGLSEVSKQVIKGLKLASAGMKGALGKISEMAILASSEFTKTGKPVDKVNTLLAKYEPTFKTLDHNVKKHFANALWLLVSPESIVEIAPPKGKSGAVTSTALEAVKNAGKHTIQMLAKEAREEAGAGRKAAAKKVVPKQGSFFSLLEAALKDKEQLAKLKAALAKHGYALTKITKISGKDKPSALVIIPQVNKITDQVASH